MTGITVNQLCPSGELGLQKVFEPELIDFFFLNRSAYAKNPFDNVSAEELQEYQRIIDSKSRQGDGEWL